MSTVILRTASRFLLVLLLAASVFVLLRGHDEPGGGFIGGLLSASAFLLYGLAHGMAALRRMLRVDPRTILAAGLLVALAAAGAGWIAGRPFLTGLWAPDPIPGIGKLSTVLAFDLGVHLTVLGASLVILVSLAEDDS